MDDEVLKPDQIKKLEEGFYNSFRKAHGVNVEKEAAPEADPRKKEEGK